MAKLNLKEFDIANDPLSLLMLQERKYYFLDRVIGELRIDTPHRFCYTLEDTVRDYGVKIPKLTAIPADIYRVELTYSKTFKKILPLIYNTSERTIDSFGVKFSGVRYHGGNRPDDTEGCPLIGFKFNEISNEIYNSAANEFLRILEKLQKKYTNGIYVKIY